VHLLYLGSAPCYLCIQGAARLAIRGVLERLSVDGTYRGSDTVEEAKAILAFDYWGMNMTPMSELLENARNSELENKAHTIPEECD